MIPDERAREKKKRDDQTRKQDSVLAIISLGTYQTIDALLTGYGPFGLHPPRCARYSVLRPFSSSLSSGVLTFLQDGCPSQRWPGMIVSLPSNVAGNRPGFQGAPNWKPDGSAKERTLVGASG
jgi:hypothetical protein